MGVGSVEHEAWMCVGYMWERIGPNPRVHDLLKFVKYVVKMSELVRDKATRKMMTKAITRMRPLPLGVDGLPIDALDGLESWR